MFSLSLALGGGGGSVSFLVKGLNSVPSLLQSQRKHSGAYSSSMEGGGPKTLHLKI